MRCIKPGYQHIIHTTDNATVTDVVLSCHNSMTIILPESIMLTPGGVQCDGVCLGIYHIHFI